MEPLPLQSPRRRLAVLAALWLAFVGVLALFHGVLLPFGLAALLAYLMAPVLDAVQRLKLGAQPLPRWAAILLLYAVLLLGFWLFLVAIAPQIYREISRITRDAAAYFGDLTPARVQTMAQAAERWLN